MDSKCIEIVQQSWNCVLPISGRAAALLYQRLFELDPSLRPLFKSDFESQGGKVTSMITRVVVNLDNLSVLVPAIEDLGRRHVGYGVQARHYALVGAALLWALEHTLGEDFDAETREAWSRAYTILAEIMQSAAAHLQDSQRLAATG
jgi:hemoglobin-like flavoprotein